MTGVLVRRGDPHACARRGDASGIAGNSQEPGERRHGPVFLRPPDGSKPADSLVLDMGLQNGEGTVSVALRHHAGVICYGSCRKLIPQGF